MTTVRLVKAAVVIVTLAVWAGLLRLCIAFVRSELDWATVASYSRRDAPWYYRLAAVWGGLEGSLWLFVAILGLVIIASLRHQRSAVVVAYGLCLMLGLVVIAVVLVNPFRRLAVPARGGFGLTPILEHPAMAIHPPLLYAGLASTLPAMFGAVQRDTSRCRNWLRISMALITVAIALGGLWSYMEQGWGGYWAWDPVENTSMMVWLAILVALHAQQRWTTRTGAVMLALPWLLTLVGACIVRSGSTPSIHGFGQRASVGWALLGLTAATTALVWIAATSAIPSAPTNTGARSSSWNVRIFAAILFVTTAGTLAPIAVDLFSDRPAAVRGRFYSAFIGPAALVAVPFVGARLRHRTGRLAHVGALVLVLGIAASTFDTKSTIIIGPGATVRTHGVEVTNREVLVSDGPRQQSTAVTAVLEVDGKMMYPALVAFRDRGGRLHENDIVSRPWRDVQVQLDTANDAGVVTVTVYTRPLMWLVWAGAVVIALGALLSRRRPVVEVAEGSDVLAYVLPDR